MKWDVVEGQRPSETLQGYVMVIYDISIKLSRFSQRSLAQKARSRVEVFCVCSILPGRTLPGSGQIVVKVVCLTKINRQFGQTCSGMPQ